MTNKEIAKLLRHVAASYTIKNENKFRFQIIAYQKAADAIENTSSEINDLLKEGKLEKLPGVGVSISSHIEELLKTGEVKHFNWVLKDIPEAIFPLLDVPTFGPKKAYKLVTHFKLRNKTTAIDDLENFAKQGKIASVEGYGEKSEQDIIRAISDFKKGKGKTTRMLLPYAFEIAEKICSYLRESKAVIEAQPLGSLRRMSSTTGDIDIAVSSNDPKTAIKHFVSYPYKDRVIEEGEISASILTSSGRQIDLMTQPPETFGSLLQHFTGSKHHNIHLREFALKKGLSLSEKGIKVLKAGKTESFNTEEKFYKRLGLQWIPPELRENTGEIELALSHKLPTLVDLKDIKGDLHVHSSFPIEPSHDLGQNTLEEMVKVAESLGYEYIGFSEHNPSVSRHTKNKIYTLISKRNEEIDKINRNNKNTRVLKLLEIDILANGGIAVDNKCLSILDAAIVSIHSSFTMSKEDMTKRVLNGLSHPKVKILAHPTGRMFNTRAGYELDWDKIFEFCKKNDKALEINSWPERLDLIDTIVKQAVENNVKMIINTDSHASVHMSLMKYGVAVARRGWAKKDDIVNTLSYNQFVSWINK